MEIDLPANGWRPRPYQREAWDALKAGPKLSSLWWHRRSGKDEIALNHTACAAFRRVGMYWHMLPAAAQARKTMWDAVNPHTGKKRLDEIFPPELVESSRDTDMFKRFVNGSTWQLLGSDNYGSLVGAPPVGIVFSEWARANPSAWGYLSPILGENNGWAMFITTPQGKNHAYRTHKTLQHDLEAYTSLLTVDATGVYDAEWLEAERHRLIEVYGASLGEAIYQQEYYVSAEAAIVGSIYGEEINMLKAGGRVCHVSPANAPVHTAWDIGRSDATAIWWFQSVGNEIRILDYHEATLQDLGYYSEQLKGRKIRTELSVWAYSDQVIEWGDPIPGLDHRREYAYGTHYLPHDARHKTLSASGQSVETILRKSLGNVEVVDESQSGLDDSARTAVIAMLRRAWVDTRAEQGLEILGEYRYRYNESLKVMSREPVHDFSSHCADAARVMALVAPRSGYAMPMKRRERDMGPGSDYWWLG